jgi:hypothetical protein
VKRYDHVGAEYVKHPSARAILMTATVTPPPSAVARADPVTRLRDYCDAMTFYLSLPSERFDRIIFADNSDSDLNLLLELVARKNRDKRVELLSFQANDHRPALGKAYGEFRILDVALSASACLRQDDHVWKTTGRLRCLNITTLDVMIDRDYCVVCDLFNVPFVRSGHWREGGSIDLRLFRFQPTAYDQWLRGTNREGPEPFDENFLYRIMVEARKEATICPRFPIQPIIAGISGRTQRDYLSTGQRFKDYVRGSARRFAPWLWV